MLIPQIETQCLILRAFCEKDLDAYAEMCADPEVMRYIGKGQTLSRFEAWRSMAARSLAATRLWYMGCADVLVRNQDLPL